MRKTILSITETFQSGAETERKAALQRALDTYLSHALQTPGVKPPPKERTLP